MKGHTYYFKCTYTAPNSVTGKIETYTGRASVEVESRDKAIELAPTAFIKNYPHALEIREIRINR
jgi:hypothetical protein